MLLASTVSTAGMSLIAKGLTSANLFSTIVEGRDPSVAQWVALAYSSKLPVDKIKPDHEQTTRDVLLERIEVGDTPVYEVKEGHRQTSKIYLESHVDKKYFGTGNLEDIIDNWQKQSFSAGDYARALVDIFDYLTMGIFQDVLIQIKINPHIKVNEIHFVYEELEESETHINEQDSAAFLTFGQPKTLTYKEKTEVKRIAKQITKVTYEVNPSVLDELNVAEFKNLLQGEFGIRYPFTPPHSSKNDSIRIPANTEVLDAVVQEKSNIQAIGINANTVISPEIHDSGSDKTTSSRLNTLIVTAQMSEKNTTVAFRNDEDIIRSPDRSSDTLVAKGGEIIQNEIQIETPITHIYEELSEKEVKKDTKQGKAVETHKDGGFLKRKTVLEQTQTEKITQTDRITKQHSEFIDHGTDVKLDQRDMFSYQKDIQDNLNNRSLLQTPGYVHLNAQVDEKTRITTAETIIQDVSNYHSIFGLDLDKILGKTTQTKTDSKIQESEDSKRIVFDNGIDVIRLPDRGFVSLKDLGGSVVKNETVTQSPHKFTQEEPLAFEEGWIGKFPLVGGISNLGSKASLGAPVSATDAFWAAGDILEIGITVASLGTATVATIGIKAGAKAAVKNEGKQIVQGIAKMGMKSNPANKIPCRNANLVGRVHPETGVPFKNKTIKIDGQDVEGVFPDFTKHTAFETKLPPDLHKKSDFEHFSHCNQELKKAFDKGVLKNENFSKQQFDQIKNGDPPRNYTWHHNESPGKMQLVDTEIHSRTGHTGGRSIWGGGTEFRNAGG